MTFWLRGRSQHDVLSRVLEIVSPIRYVWLSTLACGGQDGDIKMDRNLAMDGMNDNLDQLVEVTDKTGKKCGARPVSTSTVMMI